jgi:excisionase family DNA binding protein
VSVVPSPAPVPEYLTARDLAGMLQVNEGTIYRWARDSTMPALRQGGVVRFPRDRVLKWLRDHEQGSTRPVRAIK